MLLFPASASALTKGLNTDLTWGIGSSAQDQTMAGLQDVGAGWHRLVLAWHDVETSNNRYSSSQLSNYDAAFQKAEAAGINLIVTVYTAPSWASGVSNRESPPQNAADYADFMSFAANRWGSKVEAWEIWNEQNAQAFWSTGPDPAHYARILKAAYPAVKAADPTAQVVYGGTWENDYEFLEGAYAEVPNLGDYFDVLGTHPYNGVASPDGVALRGDGRIQKWSFAGYRELREVMLDHGDDKPIWFTEFGWSTFNDPWGVTEAAQAAFLTKSLQCAEQDPYVQVAIWYAFRNHPYGGDGQNWEYQLGLTRTNFTPKPSYNAFKSYASGSGGCTYQYPPGSEPDPEPEPEPEPQPEPQPEPTPAPEPEPMPEPEADSNDADPDSADGEVSEDPVQSSTVSASGRPEVHVRFVRTGRAKTAARSRGARRQRTRADVFGRVKHADSGRVVIRMQRRDENGNWRHTRLLSVRMTDDGRFHRSVELAHGRWRLRAVYHEGSSKKTRSRLVYFRG